MDTIQDTIIVIGLASAGLLWVLCIAGALHALWDTFGEQVEDLIKRIRR